jgi:hypothetical protein
MGVEQEAASTGAEWRAAVVMLPMCYLDGETGLTACHDQARIYWSG